MACTLDVSHVASGAVQYGSAERRLWDQAARVYIPDLPLSSYEFLSKSLKPLRVPGFFFHKMGAESSSHLMRLK